MLYRNSELNENYYFLLLVLIQIGNYLQSVLLIASCTLAKRKPLSLQGVSSCIILELQVHDKKNEEIMELYKLCAAEVIKHVY